jgi:hypothetical protein
MCPKHVEFFTKINFRNSESRWILLQEYICHDARSSECQLRLHVSVIRRNKTGIVRINITLRHVCITLLPWKRSITYSEFPYIVLGIQRTNDRAPYYIVICGLSGCTVSFPHYLANDTNFGKTLPNIKCVLFLFSVQLLSEIFVIRRRVWLDGIVYVLEYSWKVSCVVAGKKNRPQRSPCVS